MPPTRPQSDDPNLRWCPQCEDFVAVDSFAAKTSCCRACKKSRNDAQAARTRTAKAKPAVDTPEEYFCIRPGCRNPATKPPKSVNPQPGMYCDWCRDQRTFQTFTIAPPNMAGAAIMGDTESRSLAVKRG